jgi:HK97 family phage portal protein
MSIFNYLNPVRTMEKIETEKHQEKGQSVGVFSSGGKKASWFDINDHEVISNGYNTNPYVYAVVNRLAMLMATIPIRVQKVVSVQKYAKYKAMDWGVKLDHLAIKEEALEDMPEHPIQELLDRPNDQDGGFEFRYNFFINKLVTGNAFLEAIKPTRTRPPVELWNLPPLGVTLNESNNFYDKILEAYFNWGVTSKTIPKELLMHSRYYNPAGSVYGLSPLSAARRAVQSINDGDEWNASLLQNGAKPEFIIIVADGTSDEQKTKLKEKWKKEYSGPHKVSSDPIIMEEGFMKLDQLGYTVKDMDWANSQLTNMRKVYDVYGVNSEVFNDPGNKTMSNKKEGMRSLYVDRMLPEVDSFRDELQRWLVPMFGEEGIVLDLDLAGIDALNDEKDKVAERMAKSEWLTMNEKRQEMGYEVLDIKEFNEPWLGMGKLPLSEILLVPEFTEEEKALTLKEYARNGKN